MESKSALSLRKLFHKLLRNEPQAQEFSFSHPTVIIHSDDWGRIGVRDRDGFDELRAAGIRLGAHPYDLYTLETADDVAVLASVLLNHRDSAGRPACMVMNFCTANLDFDRMSSSGFECIELLSLACGLPGRWSRPGLLNAYRDGFREGVFFPALHGRTHFCLSAVKDALQKKGERAQFLKSLWAAETPYIYWRMPWVGYEFWNPERANTEFLAGKSQKDLIQEACREFELLFDIRPFSACAPGYRANRNTHCAWAESGIRVAQNGTGSGLRAPHVDELGMLHLYRNLDFEPSQKELEIEKYLEIAECCFARGIPLVISVHSINFHSSLKDFRTPTLKALDLLLSALERRYPHLHYLNDQSIYELALGSVHSQLPAKTQSTSEPRSLQEVI